MWYDIGRKVQNCNACGRYVCDNEFYESFTISDVAYWPLSEVEFIYTRTWRLNLLKSLDYFFLFYRKYFKISGYILEDSSRQQW